MPLQAINLDNKYSSVFGTIGPAREEWGDGILTHINAYWQSFATYKADFLPRLKFETSNEGYPHFHIALMFQERTKYREFIKSLQKYMSQFKKDKPTGYDKTKEFSIRLFSVPIKESVNSKVLRGADLINHYLDNPTKEKSTDGNNFTLELEGFNAYACIEAVKDELEQAAMRAWLKKYHKLKSQGVDLPPLLSHVAIHNMPCFKHMETSWKYSRLNPKNQI